MIRVTLIVLSMLASLGAAHADSNAAQAIALFDQGKELQAQGNLADACAAFDSSYALAPAITTQLNQAACREANGQFATAWGLFQDVKRQTRSAADDESIAWGKIADARAAKLKPILSTLTIKVPGAARLPNLAIARGQSAISFGEWNHALPIDGGTYTIVVTAPGHVEWRASIAIGRELDTKTIEIPILTKLIPKFVPLPPPPLAKTPFILGGSALALAGIAIGFEVSGAAAYRTSEREANDTTQRALFDSAKRQRYVAQVIGVASVATAGVALWLHLRDLRQRRRAVELAPLASPAGIAGIVLEGSW